MSAAAVALAALGGGAGSVLRYRADLWLKGRWAGAFPLPTFCINLTGSLLLGLLAGLTAGWAALLGVGVLGGYTTFSTASVETVRLLRGGRASVAAAYALGSLVACWAAAAAGLGLAAMAG